MNTDQLKKSAEEAKASAQDFINSPQVQGAINKGKDILSNAKDKLSDVKDKLEDFVEDKTDGKGILGFGEKEK